MLLRKPTIADIYVKQLQTRLDRSFVALFPPDAVDIVVGTIGRFVDGRFDRRGHLAELLGGREAFRDVVAIAPPSAPADYSFHSQGAVQLAPSATASVAGKQLLKTRLCFSGNRAVVASFIDVQEHTVSSPRTFDDLLWRLYLEGELDPDENVVASCRVSASGTVLVNRKGGVDVEVTADPAVVGAALSLGGLGAGVQFGQGSQVSSLISGPNLIMAIRAKGLGDRETDRIEDVRRFDGSGPDQLSQLEGEDVPDVSADGILCDVDFAAPEE